MELFNYKGALEINDARIQHLDSLQLNFNNKTVFETGCGGRGDITRYLLSKNARNVLIGSHIKLENPLFVEEFISDFTY